MLQPTGNLSPHSDQTREDMLVLHGERIQERWWGRPFSCGGHCYIIAEFPSLALEALRQPVESGRTTVARAAAHVTYPARFQLIAAMNPCRCGYFGNAARECGRAPRCAETYQGKISGPLMDRIDLVVEVYPISPSELSRAPPGEPSVTVAARVAAARARQRARSASDTGWLNSEVEIDAILLEPEARRYAEAAAEKLGLSARGFTRLLRVARSIGDLAGVEAVRRMEIAEALAYRHRRPGAPSLRPTEKRIA